MSLPISALLTPDEMAKADRLAIGAGPFDGYSLMCNAGAAVTAEILARYPAIAAADVLCGPGNNGGDGYVVARLLNRHGIAVRLWREEAPRTGTEAFRAAADCPVEAGPLAGFTPGNDVVVDALFGAGLSRPLSGASAQAALRTAQAKVPVVAVDLPSGISGAGGQVPGEALRADLTVTFFRKKPGHLLQPGRARCGAVVVADIGIPDTVLDDIAPACFENGPSLWAACFPQPDIDAHKYRRGQVAVCSGGSGSTGAARLSARGAARSGAGAVTVLSPGDAMLVNAMHLTAIMLRRVDRAEDLGAFQAERKPSAVILGPGFGVGEKARVFALTILQAGESAPAALILDADGITAFRDDPQPLFAAARTAGVPSLVLTPHEGEFSRLFPDLARDHALSKLDRARQAAARASAVVILKGPDTVVAAPNGRAAINANGVAWLATAGSGDVLCGIVAGLIAQGMPVFEAACAAVWLHAEAGRRFGAGLIAEDLPERLPGVLAGLIGAHAP